MQIKKKMSEMKNADVRFISLVHRAANRIPFRVVKSDQENQMLNLSSLGRTTKGTKQPDAPEIVGIVVFQHEDAAVMESVKAVLKAEGFKVDEAVPNDDGTVMFKQADLPQDTDTTIVRLSEHLAVVAKGFSPYSQTLSESTDFNEIMPAAGFYNGVRTASEALMMTVGSILQKADSGANAASQIADATAKFGTYVTTMAKALPAAAFKADLGVDKVLADAAKAKEAVKTEVKQEVKTETATKTEEVKTETIETKTEEVKTEVKTEPAQKSDAPDVAALVAQALGPVIEAVNAIKGSVEKITETQNNFSAELEKVSRKAEDATKQVTNTVIAAAKDDRQVQQTKTVKQDDDPRTGLFDSANFARRNR